MLDSAVILAAGLGTRMRRADADAGLTDAEAAVADRGVKAMLPIGQAAVERDRPFLDYVLSALADAGFGRACLVIAPDHHEIRDYYTRLASRRIAVEFAVQPRPRGTADALAAAEGFAAGGQVLAINSDNYYPPEALRAVREELSGSGLAAFTPEGLRRGNVPPERIARFAVVRTDAEGLLTDIVEKPGAADLASTPGPVRVSMNCWRFEPSIFDACRAVGPSPRGEYELPDAVRYAMARLGTRFRAVTVDAPVLDLSRRSDLAAVKAALAGVEVNL